MARRWNAAEEKTYRAELERLYVRENKSISEVAHILGIAQSSVFLRLKRLNIQSSPDLKIGFRNMKRGIQIPSEHSALLAEFFGIMLGDGHISRFQTIVTLGTKELEYVEYVASLMKSLFGVEATILTRQDGYRDVYIGSVTLTSWLENEGLVRNKVALQVDVPSWVFQEREYMIAFLRGFFDTDGSIYRIRHGIQVSLTNKSLPLLHSLRRMLLTLQYTPSEVGSWRVYLTRRPDIRRFFNEVQPANTKHLRRYRHIESVGVRAVN
jgi:intein/homing endonuclease